MRGLPIDGDLMTFCQETAGVAPTPGAFFGDAFDGFRAFELWLPARHFAARDSNGCARRWINWRCRSD